MDLNASATIQFSDYGGAEPLFLRSRDDDFYQVTAGLTYRPYKALAVMPQLRYTRNKSNIALNDYDRFSAWVTARYTYR